MTTTCPKCSYTRQPTDKTPDYSCPSCGIVYAKYDAQADLARRIDRAAKTGNWSGVPPEHVPQQAPALERLLQQAAEQFTETASAPLHSRPVSIKARYDAMDLRITQRTNVGIDVWMLVLLVVATIAWLFATQERRPLPFPEEQQARQAEEAAATAQRDRIQLAIKERRVVIGMTAGEIHEAWGRPSSINRTENAYGGDEQWVHGGGRYVYLHNNVVTSVQTSKR